MPLLVRLLTGIFAVGLWLAAAYALRINHPLSWKQGFAVFGMFGVGFDFMLGAIRARWPFGVAMWFIP